MSFLFMIISDYHLLHQFFSELVSQCSCLHHNHNRRHHQIARGTQEPNHHHHHSHQDCTGFIGHYVILRIARRSNQLLLESNAPQDCSRVQRVSDRGVCPGSLAPAEEAARRKEEEEKTTQKAQKAPQIIIFIRPNSDHCIAAWSVSCSVLIVGLV